MRFNVVRLAERNVDMTAIGLPAGFPGGKVIVGILNAPVVLFAELIIRRIGIRIAALPKSLDKRVALFIVAQ